jgi:hypothetical protein
MVRTAMRTGSLRRLAVFQIADQGFLFIHAERFSGFFDCHPLADPGNDPFSSISVCSGVFVILEIFNTTAARPRQVSAN